MQEFTIDATNKSLGRIASEAAKALMGKSGADYTPHIQSDVRVKVSNAGKIHMSERKRHGKVYTSYSGHPGGLKRETLGALVERNGKEEALRRAIERMLPRNRLRNGRMKRLTIER